MIPIPAKVIPREGTFTLDAGTSIHASEELRVLAESLRDTLRAATGLPFPINSATGTSRVELALANVEPAPPSTDMGKRVALRT